MHSCTQVFVASGTKNKFGNDIMRGMICFRAMKGIEVSRTFPEVSIRDKTKMEMTLLDVWYALEARFRGTRDIEVSRTSPEIKGYTW